MEKGIKQRRNDPYGWGVNEKGEEVAIKEQQDVITTILERRLFQTPKKVIAKELNEIDIPAPRGGKWNDKAISNIISRNVRERVVDQNLKPIGEGIKLKWEIEAEAMTPKVEVEFECHDSDGTRMWVSTIDDERFLDVDNIKEFYTKEGEKKERGRWTRIRVRDDEHLEEIKQEMALIEENNRLIEEEWEQIQKRREQRDGIKPPMLKRDRTRHLNGRVDSDEIIDNRILRQFAEVQSWLDQVKGQKSVKQHLRMAVNDLIDVSMRRELELEWLKDDNRLANDARPKRIKELEKEVKELKKNQVVQVTVTPKVGEHKNQIKLK